MCTQTSGCNDEQPSLGFETKWVLTRYIPVKITPPSKTVLDYISQTDILPTNGPWTNNNWVDTTNGL